MIQENIITKLKRILHRHNNRIVISPTDKISERLNSVDFVEFILIAEEEFDIVIDDKLLSTEHLVSLEKLEEVIKECKANQ